MTAIRDRRSDPDADDVAVPWDQRPIAVDRRGLPWWGAVLLGFGLALVGAAVDLQIGDALGNLFKGAYFIGVVGAICAVQRRSLFAPMVQPPLVLAVIVPGVMLVGGNAPAGGDGLAKALQIGQPLINGFPTMAITTGIVLAIGIYRIYRERDPDPRIKKLPRKAVDKDRGGDPAGPRTGAAGRPAPARAGRPAEGRPGARRRPGEPGPSGAAAAAGAAGARKRPDDGGARRGREGDGGLRGGKTPPPPGTRGARQPRQRPVDGERRRTDAPRSGQPDSRGRRTPPPADDPRADRPRRGQDRRGNPPPPPPRRRSARPWENED
ncbi:DUF6542 domain-containing protein [Amycolatopsis nigrescens]|uniref:DUF6542 domain-containing protein n=1 Tax=Amycolatopsis nigrescens TaxID=381445 RepID=UPI00037A339D|nr:DUF6542 domain-containing protein [Amycolatopsis nigrescens]